MRMTRPNRIILELHLCFFLIAGCGDNSHAMDASQDGSENTRQDAGPVCTSDAVCNDGLFCNGIERCAPTAPNAGANGCVLAEPPCISGQSCNEDRNECQTRCDLTPDADGDGWNAAECGGDDCDDSNPMRFPGNIEVCDAANVDEDCNGDTFGMRDIDGDGAIDAMCCNGTVCGNDCNDARREIGPSATEVCNGIDDNCNGVIDEELAVDGYVDRDFDGYGAIDTGEMDGGASVRMRGCPGQLGFSEQTGDCDDSNRARSPGLVEACDGVDNDCDDVIDNNTTAVNWYIDADEDGFGSPGSAVRSCAPPTLPAGQTWVLIAFDCDDTNPEVNPAAPEICDGRDNDCNGRADYVISGSNTEDDDRDGYPDIACSPGGDCNDLDTTTYPGALESCDMRDNDCNGIIDDGIVMRTWYEDEDGDGDAAPGAASIVSCLDYRSTRALTAMDCDDSDPTIYGRAPEICDRKVNRCGGSNAGEDLDGDGFLGVGATCMGGPLALNPRTDCNDSNPLVFPGNTEACNGIDDDCDTVIDGTSTAALCGARAYCSSECRTGRRVFITSTAHTGNLGGLAGADAVCQTRANAASLGGTWKAYMVTDRSNASTNLDRLSHASVPYARLDGVVVANNWADLSDESIRVPITVSELGTNVNSNVWTGLSNVGGGTNQHCDNWSYAGTNCLSGSACGSAGESGMTNNHWDGYYVFSCGSGFRLYCIEQ